MKLSTVGLAAALAVTVSACSTATPYQPLAKGTAVAGGFTDQRLDATHFRVTFQGNTLTSRETVETYLLYRAAEVTVQSGFGWFETQDRHTERDRQTYVDPFYGPGYPYGFWRPRWRYWGGGWGDWGPYEVNTIQRFQASADVVMGHGPKPTAHAFDARQVMSNLGPKLVRPKR